MHQIESTELVDSAEISVEKARELATMHARIKGVLANPTKRGQAQADYIYTFQQLGLSEDAATLLCDHICSALNSDDRLDHIEARILAGLSTIHVVDGSQSTGLIDILHQQFAGRAGLIFKQIMPYLLQHAKTVDFGAGDGQVTQLIHDQGGVGDIEGYDVRAYPAAGVTVPLKVFDGKRLTTVKDHECRVSIATNVLHHAAQNDDCIDELSRVTADRLIILETVPVGESEEEMQADMDRTFMNDYLYNRLFHNADVPVPGTFDTPKGWRTRFASRGWQVVAEHDLGIDQKVIKDRHYLLVLERIPQRRIISHIDSKPAHQ